MAGYSGTPLITKLGLKPGETAAVVNPPWDYAAMLSHDGDVVQVAADAPPDGVTFLHVFTPIRAELDTALKAAVSCMARDGMIWVSWPKKASKLPSEITEDTVRELCLPLGLVDVKVCAVDVVWSGLKLVIRKKLR